MSNYGKKVLSNLAFDFKAKLVHPVIATDNRSSYTIAPDGSLIYDDNGIGVEQGLYLRRSGAWVRLLTESDFSSSIDFNDDGDLLANRDTIRQYVESLVTSVGGRFRGAWDASTGAVPDDADIKAGDSWRVSVGGTIVGLNGITNVVEPGDLLIASEDDATSDATKFFALQTNINDSSQIIVGAGFTPQDGDIEGTDDVKTALEKLAYRLGELSSADDLAGDGIVLSSDRLNVDLAPNSGLELTATDGTGQLQIKGLANYSDLDTVPIGYDNDGNLVIEVGAISFAQAGRGLTFNPSTGKIDLGGEFETPVSIISNENMPFQIYSGTDEENNAAYVSLGISAFTGASMRRYSVTHSSFVRAQENGASLYVEVGSEDSSNLELRTDGLYFISTFAEYARPDTGEFYNLAVDSNGKIVFSNASVTTAKRYAETITGNGSDAIFSIDHNFNTEDVIVQVYDLDSQEQVEVIIGTSTANNVSVIFSTPPANGAQYRVIVL